MTLTVGLMKSYWWRSVPNFGDAIGPLLIKHFTGLDTMWSPVKEASVISVGSILEHLPMKWEGTILGSGRLKENSKLDLSRATILGLRGPLSARGIYGDFALGDPGILANELVGAQPKKWDLGILPHWRDTELVGRFTRLIRPPATIKIIDPRDNPLEVVRQIGACRRIVTSSLHGTIVADSFGIPRRVEVSPALANEGGDFKFRDYHASINTTFEQGKMVQPSIRLIEDIKFEVFDAFEALASAFEGI